MDLDSLISQIEGKSVAKKATDALDIDAILKDFDVKPDTSVVEAPKKTSKVAGEPKPPISGISKEASDEINSQRSLKGDRGSQRRSLPTTNIQEAAYEADVAGKEMFSSGVGDLNTGHPYKGIGKTALGTVMRLTSPMAGIIEGGVSTPLTDITGNKGFGDRAGLIVGGLVPADKGLGALNKTVGGIPALSRFSTYSKNKALNTLVENIGPENLSTVVKEMKANPRLAPADLSPRVLQDTQHLFANDGPQINYLKNTSDARMATRKSAIEEAYDTAGGISPNLAQKVTDLAQAAKKVGNEKIQPTLTAAKPVNISKTLEAIDQTLKPGILKIGDSQPLTEVKRQLENIRKDLRTSKEHNASDLHSFQSGLRVTAENLLKSSTGTDKEVGKALMNVRNSLVSDIDKSAPGYKSALSSYRDEMHIADAFKEGHDKILTSSKKIEDDPSFVKKWFDGLTEHEQAAAREGVRAAAYTEMGVAKNPALAGESIMRSDFNKAKMEIILGKEEANTLFKALDDERKIANTHNKVIEGAQTAMRTASKSQFALPDKTDAIKAMVPTAIAEGANAMAGGYPILPTLALAGVKAGTMAKDAVSMKLAREHNAKYAKLALPTEGPSRDELIKSLESFIPQPKMTMLNKVRASLPSKP